ncbi:hypothetical protein CPB84DRAFT_1737154 [Gymnopilus junonius]|uniref:Uncharacterized protein n=1 Tax=Gymnopilus junonius TaxID=109634 RepID=A0A9P5TGN8_GYMJU|nr:hypothetical protein CPB84DRAFT_1737154 [Gymnopilus junonius]
MSQLPNPFTPFAFFAPEEASQTSVFFYVSVGALAIFVWDLLDNLYSDYKIISGYRITVVSVTYLSSRRASVKWHTQVVSLLTSAPVGNCRKIGLATGWLYPLSVAVTSFLFLVRVHAIYNRNWIVSSIFFTLWLGVIIGASTVPFSTRASEIGPTKFCFTDVKTVPSYLTASGVLTLAFDTSVYLAITWRLTRDAHYSRHRSGKRILHLITFQNIPILSRALLQDGQKYYLSTTTAHLVSTILFNINSLPLPYRFILSLPSQAVMNIMACRAYRSIRFGNFEQVMIAPTSQIASTRKETPLAVTIGFRKVQHHTGVCLSGPSKSSTLSI